MTLTAAALADTRHHLHPYTQLRQLEKDGPLVIVKGDGVHVEDEQGRRYLEGMAGLWCASLGFSERRLADAAERQMRTLPYYHSFSGKVPGPVTELVQALDRWSPIPGARVLFANSGSESNDTAVKLVRYYNNARGRPLKKKIIGRVKGYHGVTVAAASLSGIPTMHQHFDLPMDGVVRVSCPHAYQFARDGESPQAFAQRLAQELEDTIQREGPDTVAAFIAEPVQGAGGVIVPPPGYFDLIQPILKKHDVLFIADEVITGFGRAGDWSGSRLFGVQPDLMCLAKAITNGYFPFGAVMISPELDRTFSAAPADTGFIGHGYTSSAHPVGAAAALVTLEEMSRLDLAKAAATTGQHLLQGLRAIADGYPEVGDVRGAGLMLAVELVNNPATASPMPAMQMQAIQDAAYRAGVLLRINGPNLILSPPLVISATEAEEILVAVEVALDEVLRGGTAGPTNLRKAVK